MTRTTIIILFSLISCNCIAQVKSIVVYSAKEDFLITKIEKILIELRDAEKNTTIFDNVTNLNQITSNIASESALREVVDFYSKQVFELDDEAKSNYELITQVLLQNDLFLVVNTNLIFDAIEYQFYLYEIKSTISEEIKNPNLFPTTNPLSPIKTENIIINLKDDKKYYHLETAIKRLFPNIGIPPIAKININKNIQNTSNVNFCSIKDTLRLLSSFSTDVDTDKNDLKYLWRQIDLNGNINIVNSPIAQIKRLEESVDVIFSDEGLYKFGLKLYDGINYSKEDTINIQVLSPPNILISKEKIKQVGYRGLLNRGVESKSNNFTLLSREYDNWNLIVKESILSKSDTLGILKYYNLKRKKYEKELYDHLHGGRSSGMGGSYRPPKPEPIPEFNVFLQDPVNYQIQIDTSIYDDGIDISIPFDHKNLHNTKVQVFLENNGVKSNAEIINIHNRVFTPFSLTLNSPLLSYAKLKHDTIPNDSIQINFREFGASLNLRLAAFSNENPENKETLSSSFDIGLGYSYIPRNEFLLDTIRYIKSSFNFSFTSNWSFQILKKVNSKAFIQFSYNLYPIKRTYDIPPKEVSAGRGSTRIITSETETNVFSNWGFRYGLSFNLDEYSPFKFILFYNQNGKGKSKSGNIFFEKISSGNWGIGIRYKIIKKSSR